MSCAEWQEQVALYAGGDTVEPEVVEHVQSCEGCSRYASELRASIEQWRDMPDIPEQALVDVRRRVHARLNRPRLIGWWIAAAAAVALVALLVPRNLDLREDKLVLSLPAPPAAPEVKIVATAQPSPIVKPRRAQHGSSMIKILTDDPDVVILLVEFEGGFE